MKNLFGIIALVLLANVLFAQDNNPNQHKDNNKESREEMKIIKSVDNKGNEVVDTILVWYMDGKSDQKPEGRPLLIQDDGSDKVDTVWIYDLNKKEGEREYMIVESIDENGNKIIDTVTNVSPQPAPQPHPHKNRVEEERRKK